VVVDEDEPGPGYAENLLMPHNLYRFNPPCTIKVS
jgi:hypothetical protein